MSRTIFLSKPQQLQEIDDEDSTAQRTALNEHMYDTGTPDEIARAVQQCDFGLLRLNAQMVPVGALTQLVSAAVRRFDQESIWFLCRVSACFTISDYLPCDQLNLLVEQINARYAGLVDGLKRITLKLINNIYLENPGQFLPLLTQLDLPRKILGDDFACRKSLELLELCLQNSCLAYSNDILAYLNRILGFNGQRVFRPVFAFLDANKHEFAPFQLVQFIRQPITDDCFVYAHRDASILNIVNYLLTDDYAVLFADYLPALDCFIARRVSSSLFSDACACVDNACAQNLNLGNAIQQLIVTTPRRASDSLNEALVALVSVCDNFGTVYGEQVKGAVLQLPDQCRLDNPGAQSVIREIVSSLIQKGLHFDADELEKLQIYDE